jgi:hypothetical protein
MIKLKSIGVPVTVSKLKNDASREGLYNEMLKGGVKEKAIFDLITGNLELKSLFGDVIT